MSVSSSSQDSGLSNQVRGCNSRHGYQGPIATTAARAGHRRGSYPRTQEFNSPSCDRSASGEAMICRVNRAPDPFVGANERWVQLPPLRLISCWKVRSRLARRPARVRDAIWTGSPRAAPFGCRVRCASSPRFARGPGDAGGERVFDASRGVATPRCSKLFVFMEGKVAVGATPGSSPGCHLDGFDSCTFRSFAFNRASPTRKVTRVRIPPVSERGTWPSGSRHLIRDQTNDIAG